MKLKLSEIYLGFKNKNLPYVLMIYQIEIPYINSNFIIAKLSAITKKVKLP